MNSQTFSEGLIYVRRVARSGETAGATSATDRAKQARGGYSWLGWLVLCGLTHYESLVGVELNKSAGHIERGSQTITL